MQKLQKLQMHANACKCSKCLQKQQMQFREVVSALAHDKGRDNSNMCRPRPCGTSHREVVSGPAHDTTTGYGNIYVPCGPHGTSQ